MNKTQIVFTPEPFTPEPFTPEPFTPESQVCQQQIPAKLENNNGSRDYIKFAKDVIEETIVSIQSNMSLDDRTRSTIAIALDQIYISMKIEVSNRMTKAAGCFSCCRHASEKWVSVCSFKMKLSKKLLDRSSEDEVKMTIIHELAHAVQVFIENKTNHNQRWQALCLLLGGDGQQCHYINTTGLERTVKRYLWQNKYGDVMRFTKIRHNKIIRRANHYDYKFLGVEKWKGDELIDYEPAQYSKCACKSKENK